MPPLVKKLSRSRGLLPVAYAAVATIALVDALTQQGFAHGVLYLPVVILSAFSNRPTHVVLITLLSIALTWLGLYWAPPAPNDFHHGYVLANRLNASFALLCTAALCLLAQRHKRRLKLLVDKLHQQQQQLRRTTELAQVSLWRYELSSDTVWLSPAIAALIGVKSGSAITRQRFAQQFFGQGRLMLEQLNRGNQASTRESLDKREFEAVMLDHQQQKHFVRIQIDYQTQGDASGILQDITASQLREQQITRALERYRDVTDAVPVILWQADAQGQIYDANDSLRLAVGSARAKRVERWIELIHPQDQGRTISQWSKSIRSGHPFRMEYRLHHEDGSYVWYLATAKAERDEHGQITGWIGATVDIDYLKRQA